MIGLNTLLQLFAPQQNQWSQSWQTQPQIANPLEMQSPPKMNTMQTLQSLPGDAGGAGKLFSLLAGVVSGPDSQFRSKGSMYDLLLNSTEQEERYKPRKDR